MENQTIVNAARGSTTALCVSSNQSQYFVTRDSRYTWAQEFTGHASGTSRHVVRYMGERVADFEAGDLRSVRDCVASHAQQRHEHVRLNQLSWDANKRFTAAHWLGNTKRGWLQMAYVMRDGSVMTSAIDAVRASELDDANNIIHAIAISSMDDTANGALCFNRKYNDVVWC